MSKIIDVETDKMDKRMNKSLNSSNALLSAIKRTNKPLSIVIGSPISFSSGIGMPGVSSVSEIVNMIEEKVNQENLIDDYNEVVTSDNTNERYQEGFDFIKNFINQDAVNEIIKKAVLNAYIEKESRWHIPEGLDNLCQIIAKKNIDVANIITTNFDPLISEGIKLHGAHPKLNIFHADGSMNTYSNDIPNSIPIVHLHGFWEGADTLHTPKQLTTRRPLLKSALSNIIKNTTVLVIAYGGWDDIFTEALNDIAYDNDANVDVMWAFFENDESIVNKKYEKLLNNVKNIYLRGRFRTYYGIECNAFLATLKKQFFSRENENNKETCNTSAISIENEIKSNILGVNFSTKTSSFEAMSIKNYPTHKNIRLVEQVQFNDEIKLNNVISLVAEWGMERNGFIYSILDNQNSILHGKNIYNVDLQGCFSIDEIDNRFVERFNLSLQNFVMVAAEHSDFVILFEGVNSLDNSNWLKDFTKVLGVLKDYIKGLAIIISGDYSLVNLKYPIITLKSLSEPDIKTYITEHPEGDKDYLGQACFDSIVRLSGGLPSRLNSIIMELKIRGISTIIEDELNQRIEIDESDNDDPIPLNLKESLIRYISTKDDTRHYNLLKILSILQYGETYSRLRRFNIKAPFNTNDFLELSNSGLITTSEKVTVLTENGNTEKEPIHVIHPLVGIYIRQGIERNDYFSIVKKYLDISFGDNWIAGQIKFNQSSLRYLTDFNKSGPGNAHILICAFLRYSVEKDARREINSTFNLALAFFKFLEDNERYRDLIFSATEVKALMKESSEAIPLGRLHYSLSKGLRMLGHRKEARDEMLLALNYPTLFKKTEIASCKLEIALAYSTDNLDADALKYAEEVKKHSKSNSSYYTQAELIIAERSAENVRINNIKKVQRKAERLGFSVIKSQAILAIASLQTDTLNAKAYDSAIMNLNETYSFYNVIVHKNLNYINQNLVDYITDHDVITLCKAYSYFYTQRIDVQLNKTHQILWAVFVDRRDNTSLVRLFRYSSFIWRMNNDKASEEKYANLLNIIELNIEDSYLNELIKYARVRIKILNKEA